MDKSANVSKWVVSIVVALMLTAILGYVAFEYGFSALPEFMLVAFGVIVVIPLIVLFFGS